jgi:lactate dehydrogenase-like 2-hydroxyacid dehydrogenase
VEAFENRNRKDIRVLLTREMDPYVERSLDASYTMFKIFDEAERLAFLQARGGEIDAVVTTGLVGLKANEIALLPNVKVIHAFAVGYESVDLDAAFARNIYVSHGAGNNSFCVAEHGLALMLAMTRRIVVGNQQARQGIWHAADPRPVIFRKKLGILGLGSIGHELAKRVAAFDMEIGYHNRKPRHQQWRYFDTLQGMAAWCDYLFVACPGGKATFHLVNADVLKALGPSGYLINVSRGSVVDTRAMVDALNQGLIAGAGVDVLEGEPDVPSWVFDAPNLLLSPHIAGQSPETAIRKFELIRDNVETCFAGRPPVTPVPEWTERQTTNV